MKKLSCFAKKNPKIAIAIIILGCILLNILAFLLGSIWAILDYAYSEAIIWTVVVLIPLIFLIYYKYKLHYLQRKLSEASVYFLSAVLVFGLTFQFLNEAESHFIPNTYELLYAGTAAPPMSKKEIRKLVKQYKPVIQKYLEKKLGKKAKKLWVKILLTVGVVVLLYMLGVTLAVLSCGLSCSGQEVAAVALLFGGLALLVWGAIVLIKSIWKKTPDNSSLQSSPSEQ